MSFNEELSDILDKWTDEVVTQARCNKVVCDRDGKVCVQVIYGPRENVAYVTVDDDTNWLKFHMSNPIVKERLVHLEHNDEKTEAARAFKEECYDFYLDYLRGVVL